MEPLFIRLYILGCVTFVSPSRNWPNVIAEGPLYPSTYFIVISFGTYSDYL